MGNYGDENICLMWEDHFKALLNSSGKTVTCNYTVSGDCM